MKYRTKEVKEIVENKFPKECQTMEWLNTMETFFNKLYDNKLSANELANFLNKQ